MKRTIKALLVSCLSLACCAAVVSVASYALFSHTVTLTTHLSAGTLKATLTRTAHYKKLLNAQGFLTGTGNDNESVDFTGESTQNVFELGDGGSFVPGSEVSATFTIANESTIAFSYWIDVNFYDLDSNNNRVELTTLNNFAKQLSVVVKAGDKTYTGRMNEGAVKIEVGSLANPLGTLINADSSTTVSDYKASFTISVSFPDTDDNNDAMSQNVYFDIVVNAAQYIN